jgi:hypothetical protein
MEECSRETPPEGGRQKGEIVRPTDERAAKAKSLARARLFVKLNFKKPSIT